MQQLIIIGVACFAALFLIIFGAVTKDGGVLATGTGILGALLGAAGVKYQPAIQEVLCRLGFHKWGGGVKSGIWMSSRCQRKGCPGAKQKRAM